MDYWRERERIARSKPSLHTHATQFVLRPQQLGREWLVVCMLQDLCQPSWHVDDDGLANVALLVLAAKHCWHQHRLHETAGDFKIDLVIWL